MMCHYSNTEEDEWFRTAWVRTGRKLEDVPLEVIGEAISRVPAKKFIAMYESTRAKTSKPVKKAGKRKTAGED